MNNDVTRLLSGQGEMIPLFKVFMPPTVAPVVRNVLLSGYIGQGPKVKEFEYALQPWLGTGKVLTVNSGTSAIQLALRLAGVGPGDEVITSPMTCGATNMPILEMGARPVWADVHPDTGMIDAENAGTKMEPKTKAILCMHWGGSPCDLTALANEAAFRGGTILIEDACQAFGAEYGGKPIGAHPESDFVCCSFQAIKIMTTIDGGALVTRSRWDYKRGKLLRWFGMDRESGKVDFRCEGDVKEHGYKYHMNDVNASIGLEQLKFTAILLKKQREHAQAYNEAFADLNHIRPVTNHPKAKPSYWLYTLLTDHRDRFMAHMKEQGITTSRVHARNDKWTCFKDYQVDLLPGVDEFDRRHVCIPVGWWLSQPEVTHIVRAVQEFDQKGG